MRFVLRALPFVCLLASLALPRARPAPRAAGEGTPDAAGSVMPVLAREFQAVEKGLAEHDPASTAEHAGRLRDVCQDLSTIHPQANVDLVDVYDGYVHSLAELSAQVATLASAPDPAPAWRALEDLRATCVGCHAKFRALNDERGQLPARGNTISGQVQIRTSSGAQREDRSNVLVFLEGVPPDPIRPAGTNRYRISQKDTRFVPRVLPVLRGSTVDFPNDDFIYHNVFSLSETEPFDLGAYGPGKSKSVLFPRNGLARVYCNIHPEMVATIIVLENPCFALTDRKGLFVISGVPPGKFTLRTWHEYGGEYTRELTSAQTPLARLSISIQETKATLEHRNKFGKPYRGEYR